MIGHKICFNSEILIMIPKLSLLPLSYPEHWWGLACQRNVRAKHENLTKVYPMDTAADTEKTIPYFFHYKMEFYFSFQSNAKSLDLS